MVLSLKSKAYLIKKLDIYNKVVYKRCVHSIFLMGKPKKKELACCPWAQCPAYHAIDILCKRWTLHILRAMEEKKKMRFSQLQELMPNINTRMLSERLTELEERELIKRNVKQEKPIVIEYEITKKGSDLKNVFGEFTHWAEKWGFKNN